MRNTQLPDPHTEWTEDDARLALEEWHRSGKSISVFAREHGVSAARLYWWKKRLSKLVTASSTLSLVPATIVSAAGTTIVIRLPTGVAIEVTSPSAPPAWVAAIVNELTRSSS